MKRILGLCLSFLMILTCLSAVAEGAQFQIPLKQKTEVPVRKEYKNHPVVSGISSTTGLPASGEGGSTCPPPAWAPRKMPCWPLALRRGLR